MEAVEAEDLSTKEFAAEDEKSSMEESEVKLREFPSEQIGRASCRERV